MKLNLLLKKARSYRRFDGNISIPIETLRELVELTRFCPSARNVQPLKYLLVNDHETCSKIFRHTSWAGYLKDWDGPGEEERPTAYILVVKDLRLAGNIHCDDGIAIQTIMLGAVEKGLGGCIIGAFNKEKVTEIAGLKNIFEPLYLLALGKPAEVIEIDDMSDNNFKYWRDEKDVHHVPKRPLNEIIL